MGEYNGPPASWYEPPDEPEPDAMCDCGEGFFNQDREDRPSDVAEAAYDFAFSDCPKCRAKRILEAMTPDERQGMMEIVEEEIKAIKKKFADYMDKFKQPQVMDFLEALDELKRMGAVYYRTDSDALTEGMFIYGFNSHMKEVGHWCNQTSSLSAFNPPREWHQPYMENLKEWKPTERNSNAS